MTGKTLSARPRSAPEPVADAIDAPAAETSVPAKPAAKKPALKAAAPKAAAPKAAAAPAGGGKPQNLQDAFLNLLRKSKVPVTMFLVKGVKLQGIVTWFDNFSILLRRDGQSQLVYKHAISTIMPGQPVDADQFAAGGEGPKKVRLLQEVFLSSVRDAGVQVTMFLVNGVMLQGKVAGFDQFSLLLERGGHLQLVYKHALSTLQPEQTLDLAPDSAGDGS